MGLYNDLSPAPSYSGRAETMEGNGTETNIYSIAPSPANDAHCSTQTQNQRQCCITVCDIKSLSKFCNYGEIGWNGSIYIYICLM